MSKKPTYEDLEQRVKLLEEAVKEAKQLENLIHESKEKFRALADSTPIAVMLYQDDRWTSVNRAAETITGYSVRELLTMNFWDIVHRDHKALIQERGRKHQRGEETTNRYEFKIITKDGTEKWVDMVGTSTIIGGRPAGLISVADINERKRAEEALSSSEAELRTLINAMTDVIFVSNSEGRYLKIPETNPSLLYKLPNELLGKTLHEVFPKDQADFFLSHIRQAINTQKSVNFEYSLPIGNMEIWFNATISPMSDDMTLMVARDITDRKQAEDALRKTNLLLEQSSRFTEALLSAIPTPVFYKDREGRYLGCNRAFTEIMGVTPEQIKGRTVYELWPGEHSPVYHSKDLELMSNPARQVYEFEARDKYGVIRPVIYVKDVFRDENNQVAGIVGAFLDITERKQAEEEREKLVLELQEALKKVKLLSGLLPVCASCRKIRNDKGYWEQMEMYIRDHSEAEFSHSICPECAEKLYPEYFKKGE